MQAVVLALPIPGFVGTSSPVQVPVLPSGGYATRPSGPTERRNRARR